MAASPRPHRPRRPHPRRRRTASQYLLTTSMVIGLVACGPSRLVSTHRVFVASPHVRAAPLWSMTIGSSDPVVVEATAETWLDAQELPIQVAFGGTLAYSPNSGQYEFDEAHWHLAMDFSGDEVSRGADALTVEKRFSQWELVLAPPPLSAPGWEFWLSASDTASATRFRVDSFRKGRLKARIDGEVTFVLHGTQRAPECQGAGGETPLPESCSFTSERQLPFIVKLDVRLRNPR